MVTKNPQDWRPDLDGDSRYMIERQTLLEVGEIKTDVAVLKSEVKGLAGSIERHVTKPEFAPVKLIAYGLATSVLAAVLAAVLSLVLRR